MCLRVTCKRCEKPTFTGCGKHEEQVLRGVEPIDRCQCRALQAEAASHARTTNVARVAIG